MKYDRPEGCKAAVTTSWDNYGGGMFTPVRYKLTANIFCGERQANCTGSFTGEFLGIGHEYNTTETTTNVGKQVTEVLGALCLGCPYNEEVNK